VGDTDGCTNDPSNCNLFLSSVTKGVTASVKAAVLTRRRVSSPVATTSHVEERRRAFIQDHGTAGKANSAATLAAIVTLTKGIENVPSRLQSRQIVPT